MPSPCFQFYPEEFVGSGTVGTADPNEVCAYTMLLCLDWTETGFVYDEQRLARFCKLSVPAFRKAWAHLSDKFPAYDGRHYNPRLQREREKQEAWREKSKKGAKKANERRWPKGQGGDTMATATESPEGSPDGRIPLPLPLPLSVTTQKQLPTTPLSPTDAKVNTSENRGGWPAKVADAWTRAIGIIQPGRVGKDLAPFVRLYPDPALAESALIAAVGIYDTTCQRRSQSPKWAEFVQRIGGWVPQNQLPPAKVEPTTEAAA